MKHKVLQCLQPSSETCRCMTPHWSQKESYHGFAWTPISKTDSVVQVRLEQTTLSQPKVNSLGLPLILLAVLKKQYSSPWWLVNCSNPGTPSFEKEFDNHVMKTGEQPLSSTSEGESIFVRCAIWHGGLILILFHRRHYTEADLITASGKSWCSRLPRVLIHLPFWRKQRRMHPEKMEKKKNHLLLPLNDAKCERCNKVHA